MDNLSCILKLLVIDHEDHEVLLGLDWFRETGAGLFPKENILNIPGWAIHLEENSEENEDRELLLTEIMDKPDVAEETDWDFDDLPKKPKSIV